MKNIFLSLLILASFSICYCEQQQEMQGSTEQLDIAKEHAEKLKTLLAEIENIKKEAETTGIKCKHWEDFIEILNSEHEYYVEELKKAMEEAHNESADASDIESYRHDIDDMKKNLEGLYELPQFKTLVALLAALQDQYSEEILQLIEKGSTGKIDSATLASWQKKYAFNLNGINELKKKFDDERQKIAAAAKKQAGEGKVTEQVVCRKNMLKN